MRLFIDLEQEADLVAVFPTVGGRKFLVASREGRGFVVAEDECIANTRKGKQVLNVDLPDEGRAVTVIDGDIVAAIGDNRKMIVFGLDQVPEMPRGRGVRLQRYQRRRAVRYQDLRPGSGLTWTDSAGADLYAVDAGSRRLAGQPGRCRPHRAERIPALE